MIIKVKLIYVLLLIGMFSVLYAKNYDYYYVPFAELKITKGAFPILTETKNNKRDWLKQAELRKIKNYIKPYAITKSKAEIYINDNRSWNSNPLKLNIKRLNLAIRIKKGINPKGSIFFIDKSLKTMNKVEFEISKIDVKQSKIKKLFYKTKEKHYKALLKMGIPGGAWFRHNINQAKYKISGEKRNNGNDNIIRRNSMLRRRNQTDIQKTYSLFSGGRALSENLQLDRTLSIVSPEKATIPINTLKGITISKFDWKGHIDGLDPEKDRLSRYIPFDQYAIFFKTFTSMINLIDEFEAGGTPILKLMEPRSEEMYSKKKYQKQLCLPTNILSRIFGPSVINGIAFTGSDPYLRTGTDISVLFDSKNTRLIKNTILINYKNSLKSNNNCVRIKGKILGIQYQGVRTPNRKISSYMVIIDKKTIIVSNSLVQLSRIIKSYKKKINSIYYSDEYTYFRDRYKIRDHKESALLIISDAFIRKICSPKWRIADSRRIRTTAVLSELTAEYINRIYNDNQKGKKWIEEKNIPGIGKLRLTNKGFSSSKYGNLEFLTPVSELKIDKITKSEKQSYERFRNNYQNNWRKYFDPIAIRFYIDKKKIEIDTTIKPLIKQSKYRGMMEITKNSAIKNNSGDIHSESLLHYIMSLDPESDTMKRFGNYIMRFAPNIGNTAFNWIGNWISFYIDNSSFWKELKISIEKDKNSTSKFFKNNINRFPAAIAIEVNNSLKLTLFLTSLRAYINQTAPGLTIWETRKYKGSSYLCISAKKNTSNNKKDNFQLFYAATPQLFIFSLNENIIKQFLNRINKKSGSEFGKLKPWLGKSFGLKMNRSFLDLIDIFYNTNVRKIYRIKSWRNIFILNEWKKLNVKISPALFHSIHWKSNLFCPGDGEYIWNEKYQTMESTVFGFSGQSEKQVKFSNPLDKIESLGFGITFEGDGLRARGELIRKIK